MNRPFPACLAVFIALAPSFLLAADNPRDTALTAAARLAEQPSYTWQTATQAAAGPARGFRAAGAAGGDPTMGQTEKDGYTNVKQPGLQFATEAGKSAVFVEAYWMTLDQAAARTIDGAQRNPAQFNSAAVTNYKLPPAQLQDLLTKATDFKADGETITAKLSAEVVNELLSGGLAVGGGRGGQRGARGGAAVGGAVNNPSGSITVTVTGGVLTKFSVALAGSREFRGDQLKLDRTTTTTISDIGTTKPNPAPDAKEIVDALAAGKTPDVFVPEPGFTRLFNGRDLTGWAGRLDHWSVEDGAIVGRTTPDKPARGNNFLIAKSDGKNLIVDDFELRFCYRISASGNSGIQYRSIERDNFVVAGYQADFDGAQRFSGILYDEAGGAGGRGIMAMRGGRVWWTRGGRQESR